MPSVGERVESLEPRWGGGNAEGARRGNCGGRTLQQSHRGREPPKGLHQGLKDVSAPHVYYAL